MIHFIICISLAALALLIRAPGLGKWCFAVDEYYFSRSVSFILDKGIPEFPGGGYYTRGIALQYLSAGASFLFQEPEFAARVVPLAFGVLSIPLFFMLCRLFLPLLPALLCSIALLLSSWHIEFSRFARMYAPFQFIFFAFLYVYYKGYWKNIRLFQKCSWILAFLSIFFYEGSIFLPAILLLVFIKNNGGSLRGKKQLVAVLIPLFLLNYFFIKTGFRDLGVHNTLPPDLIRQTTDVFQRLPVILPKLTFFTALFKSPLFAFLFLCILGIVFSLYFKNLYAKGDTWSNLFSLILLALLALHQFGLLFLFLVVFFMVNSDIKKGCLRHWKIWTLLIAIFLSFWTLFGFTTKEAWLRGEGFAAFLKGMVKIVFLYPPLHTDVIYPFLKYIPVWSFFVFILIAIATVHVLAVNRENPSRFLLAIIFVCAILISILKKPFHETRYFFFFYPLLYIMAFVEFSIFVDGMKRILNRKNLGFLANGLIFIPLLLFFASEDFNLEQLRNVSSKEMNFRMGKYGNLAGHWYPRADFETPARYVNKAYSKGDIVVIDYSPISQYLKVPFINFLSPDHKRFQYEARNEGREQIWTGRPLIYDFDTLVNGVPGAPDKSLWLISIIEGLGGGSFVENNNPGKIAGRYNLSVSREYVGIDGRIGVWRFRRN